MTETWRSVVGYEGAYEVSDKGNVRSLDRLVPHYRGGTTRVKGRPIRAVLSDGRPRVMLGLGKLEHRWMPFVHTLVLEAFTGPCPEDMECRHLDGDRANNVLSNLAWGTKAENEADKQRHGRIRRRLTLEQVRDIRRRAAAGESRRAIAKAFGIAHTTVNHIVHRDIWKHAQDEAPCVEVEVLTLEAVGERAAK